MDEVNLKLRMPLGRMAPPVNGNPLSQILDAHPDTKRSRDAVGLIAELLRSLSEENILYCHWKSNWKIDDWLAGDGDLDLLVRRSDVSRFVATLGRLGFKHALLPSRKEMPGILNYYGYDESTKKFVHVHAHYQLVLGHDATKNYRIPVERPLLESAIQYGPIPTASPEIELALFVMRMTLKYSAAENAVRGLFNRSKAHAAAICDEIEFLKRRIDPVKFADDFRRLFPMVERSLFDDCLDAFANGAGAFRHLVLKRRLHNCLAAHSRSSRSAAELRQYREDLITLVNRIVLKRTVRKQFSSGGCLIAIVGGDGSGKSTCLKDLNKWLGKKFDTAAIHLGIPPKSASTWAVVGIGRLRRWVLRRIPIGGKRRVFDSFHPEVNLLQQVRWFCTARDRYRLYKKIRRFTSNGGIAICDRYPVEKLRLMDGPRIRRSLDGATPKRVQRFLIEREEWYYRHILPPDLLIVLRVDPVVAATRKLNEPHTHVIPRAKELWETDWSGTSAHLVNANQPLDSVLAEVRSLVWAEL